MTRSLWILAAIGLAGVIALTVASQTALRSVGGVEEAVSLQELLRGAYGGLVAPEPPLMVYVVPGSAEWPGFRWKVEATLLPGRAPGSPDVARSVDRIVARALATTVQERRPSGVMLLLHAPGAPDANLLFDAAGRPVAAGSVPPMEPK